MAWFKRLRKKEPKRRVVIVGLDGTPYPLLKNFIDTGVMLKLAEITRRGSLMQMSSSIPAVSSVAWTTFMTGKNSAKHNIYGFMDLKPNSYRMYFPNFTSIKCEVLWDILARDSKRSIVVNLPSTYPARELNGILIAGFVAIDLKKAVYPPSFVPKLEKINYRTDVNSNIAHKDMGAFVDDLYGTFDVREKTILDLFDNEEWDFFMAVITGTDRLHHFLWDAWENASHKHHNDFLNYYKKTDTLIGKLFDRSDERTGFLIMSDHGFTGIKKEVFLNYWLRENGYLRFSTDSPESFEEIANGSRAFTLDPSRIYINIKGKYPKGVVEAGSGYNSLRDELMEKLLEFKDAETGDEMVEKVLRKEEIYSGPFIDSAPDLVLLPKRGYDFKGSLKKNVLVEKGFFTGMHTQDDAFLYINKENINQSRKVNISDVMPTVLDIMKISFKDDLDGETLISDG